MASGSDVLAALDKFELDLVEKQWSDDIWSSEFTSCPDDISEEFSDKFSTLSYCDIVQVIEQADKIINIWLTNCTDLSVSVDGECSNISSTSSLSNLGPSWTHLQDIDYKKLLSVLFFYICKGHLNNQDVTAVHTCIKATNFYFTLLTIPGSDIYKIFQFTLFEKCLETFSLHKFLEIATGRKIKKAKSSRKSDEFSSDDEFLEMDETLTLSQQQNVVKHLNFLLSTFQQFVSKFSFKKHPEALNMCLGILAELTRIERSSNLYEFSTNNTDTSFAPLSRNAYLIMKDLCSPLHGRVSEIIRLVLFYLMPNLTSIGGLVNPELNKLNHRELANIRSIAVSYIIENIIPIGEEAHLGLKILVQQLCFNMIDRADYRAKATEMVLTILCRLPMDLYYTILKWIFRLSMMEGAHHRVISLELLSRLIFMKQGSDEMTKLTESQFQHLDSQLLNSEHLTTMRSEIHQKTDHTTNLSQEPIVSFSQPVSYVPLEYRRVMFAIIIDRIRDEASIVKTRALSILSDMLSNRTSQALQVILRDIFLHPYGDMSSIDLKDTEKENDFLKWKAFVALLDKVRDCEVSKSMIPGGRVIMNKIFEKCLDERVNVRKSALQVISSMFKFNSKWMTNESLTLFGKHCRDPAMSIRKDMLTSVTELLFVFPEHEPLVELWVDEVVPLIMDREIKVQEQALHIFTCTILFKITHFNSLQNPSEELPWKLLNRIAKQNKKSFLMTACALWSESGNLTQTLIAALRTHIGTVNDAPAWVFLSCISEYFDIEKPDFVMQYYMDVVSKGTGDLNSSYLALYTLSTSWQKLEKDQKEILQVEMFNKLKSFEVCPTLVGLTVEIVAGVTVTIAEEELAGKKEVAKWGIEMIQSCESHLEVCLKEAKESDNECKDCVNILALLGALIGVCPDKIKHPTFLLLFNYLMDTKSTNTPHDRKMRAITVITLSKMALQSDSFARSLVAGLAQLLSQSTDPIVLNNVIVAIADIGESYANLIEPLIPFICVCLKSSHKGLKEITLILLIELLQEDYLKARGALVYHLLTMINETNPWLVNIVKYYFTNSLLARNPYKMYQLLLPGLFHLNNYTNHPDYPRLEMTDAESRAFDLSGPENHSLRMNVYQFMLSNIPDMVKMKCLHFICTVVLNGAADNIIAIKNKNGEQLLFDALSILLTKEIKIEYNDLVKKKNEDGEEEDDQRQNPLYKLGKQMFSAAQKKEIIETIVPICCKLKKKLLVENKKLLPYLHKFVRELVKDYRDEVNEIFKEDKQFGIEILHELDKISNNEVEEEEEEEQQQQQQQEQPQTDVPAGSETGPIETEVQGVVVDNPQAGNEGTEETPSGDANPPVTPDDIPEKESEQVGTDSPQHQDDDLVESNPSSEAQNPEDRVRVERLSEHQNKSHLSPLDQQGEGSQGLAVPPTVKPTPKLVPECKKQTNLDTPVCRKEVASSGKPNREKRKEMKDARTGVISTSGIPMKKLAVSLERLNVDGLKAVGEQSKSSERTAEPIRKTLPGSGKSKVSDGTSRKHKEEENMEKAMHDIIMPPPVKTVSKNKKYSLSSSKSICNKTPTTPVVGGKKEPLTSTPLVAIDDPDFTMDLSSVVDETR